MRKFIAGGILLTLVGVGLIFYGVVPGMQCNFNTGTCGQPNDGLLNIGIAAAVIGVLIATVGPFAVFLTGSARGGALRRRLQQTGVPGTARILSVAETGLTVNDAPQVDLMLEVSIAGRAPYQVRHRELVPRLALGRLSDGRPLQVVVDPAHPDQLVVNWLARPVAAG